MSQISIDSSSMWMFCSLTLSLCPAHPIRCMNRCRWRVFRFFVSSNFLLTQTLPNRCSEEPIRDWPFMGILWLGVCVRLCCWRRQLTMVKNSNNKIDVEHGVFALNCEARAHDHLHFTLFYDLFLWSPPHVVVEANVSAIQTCVMAGETNRLSAIATAWLKNLNRF